MNSQAVHDQIAKLIDIWCERRELKALATVLPAWLSNNGLTDGWAEVAAAIRTASGLSLPAAETESLKRLWVEIDKAVNRR
jgi:hypothetical protein